MILATWNVNGIRARHAQVQEWIARDRPDVVCLQEIKATPDQIPELLLDLDGRDPVFEIEFRMGTGGTLGRQRSADVKADARIALRAVPVTPVAVDIEQQFGDLIGCGFDFLETDDVRTVPRDPFLNLRVTRPDAVDVPGGDLQNRACAACRSAAGTAMMSA